MPAPKGHAPYPGCEKGGTFGYLGKPKDAYTDEEIEQLGQELIAYMEQPRNIWYKSFCIQKRMTEDHLQYLIEKYPVFASYAKMAKNMQKQKLIMHPFWKEADGNFAKFILSKAHSEFKEETQNPNIQHTYHVNYHSQEQVLPKAVSASDTESA